MQTNFLLGEIKLTTAARIQLKRIPLDLICRHAINEHGHITASEARRNANGMDTLGAIISRYKADPTNPKSPDIVVYTRESWDETIVFID